MTADIHALTGAYVLDAIPEFERAAFERHLAECEACVQEVRELQATATRLGEAASDAPPPELKARVMAEIGRVRQLPPVGYQPSARRAGVPMLTKIFGAAAAVLLVVSVSLGVVLANRQGDLEDSRQQVASMAELLSADDARFVSGSTTAGLSGTVVVSRGRGQVMLLAANIPAAPSGKSYQVWLMSDGHNRSAGLLTPDGNGRASILDGSGIGDAQKIGVTVEPEGGSQAPTQPPVMEMALPV